MRTLASVNGVTRMFKELDSCIRRHIRKCWLRWHDKKGRLNGGSERLRRDVGV